jgi:hypothetical protein
MKGFISTSALDGRMANELMVANNITAFEVYEQAGTKKLVPVMYKAENVSALTSVKDVFEVGELGDRVTKVTMRDLATFGKMASDILGIIPEIKDRKELATYLRPQLKK